METIKLIKLNLIVMKSFDFSNKNDFLFTNNYLYVLVIKSLKPKSIFTRLIINRFFQT